MPTVGKNQLHSEMIYSELVLCYYTPLCHIQMMFEEESHVAYICHLMTQATYTLLELPTLNA